MIGTGIENAGFSLKVMPLGCLPNILAPGVVL
jgi:hypothetical protein